MKTYMQCLNFLFLSIIFLGFYSCRKTPNTDTNIAILGKAYSYYNHPYIQNTSGEILFQVNNLANDPAIKKDAIILGGLKDASINIAGYNIVTNSSNFYNIGYDSLYGKTILYRITPSTVGAAVLSGSFYSPAPIYATNIPPITAANILPNAVFPITWSADANNTNGVNISAIYYPTRLNNWDLAAKGDSLLLENNMIVPDNGSASLPSSFFSKFPAGATLQVVIGRGNAVYVQSGQYIYLIDGFFSSGFFVVKK